MHKGWKITVYKKLDLKVVVEPYEYESILVITNSENDIKEKIN